MNLAFYRLVGERTRKAANKSEFEIWPVFARNAGTGILALSVTGRGGQWDEGQAGEHFWLI